MLGPGTGISRRRGRRRRVRPVPPGSTDGRARGPVPAGSQGRASTQYERLRPGMTDDEGQGRDRSRRRRRRAARRAGRRCECCAVESRPSQLAHVRESARFRHRASRPRGPMGTSRATACDRPRHRVRRCRAALSSVGEHDAVRPRAPREIVPKVDDQRVAVAIALFVVAAQMRSRDATLDPRPRGRQAGCAMRGADAR